LQGFLLCIFSFLTSQSEIVVESEQESYYCERNNKFSVSSECQRQNFQSDYILKRDIVIKHCCMEKKRKFSSFSQAIIIDTHLTKIMQ